MKKLYISDFKIGDSIFGETFAVKNYKKGATRNNKPYIDVVLTDSTGDVKGKIWADDMAQCESVKEGDVILLNGTIEEFMNAPQIKITNLSKTEKYELKELQQKSNFDINTMWQELELTIKNIKNKNLSNLLNSIFDKGFIERFKSSPAGFTVHHAYLGGLLEHTWETLGMAQKLKEHFPNINMDLVNTGIILHDVGKALEFEMQTTILFTEKGKLLGHIYLGAEHIQKNAPKDMPEDLLNEVLHIVLAHHGSIEFGSPVVPKTVEAFAVYLMDNASSKLNIAYNQLQGMSGEDKFTQYIRHLGTELYRSPYSNEGDFTD